MVHRRTLVILLALCLLATACGPTADGAVGPPTTVGAPSPSTPSPSTPSEGTPSAVQGADAPAPSELASALTIVEGSALVVREVARRPHDPTAFTQGLEFHEGRLLESRGLWDEPVPLTEIDPADGSALVEVPRDPADPRYFAEGLTVVEDRIIQLTWRAGVAFVYDVDTFERVGEHTYDGEGWGICAEPDRLLMSDGTSTLTHRDRDTFEVISTVTVTLDGQPLDQINELECVDGLVWANIWRTPTIIVIDPDTGTVVATVDATALADRNGRWVEDPGATDVLNGIAHDPDTDTWLLTGKLWPVMVEVAFDCVSGCTPRVTPSTHYIRPLPSGGPADAEQARGLRG